LQPYLTKLVSFVLNLYSTSSFIHGIHLIQVNYMTMIYMGMFIPIYPPSVIILDKYGLKAGVLVGAGLTALGAWIRVFLNYSFWWALTG
jgi:fucose permease